MAARMTPDSAGGTHSIHQISERVDVVEETVAPTAHVPNRPLVERPAVHSGIRMSRGVSSEGWHHDRWRSPPACSAAATGRVRRRRHRQRGMSRTVGPLTLIYPN